MVQLKEAMLLGNPPKNEWGLEVEFSRYQERGDFDEEEQIYGITDHVGVEAGRGWDGGC